MSPSPVVYHATTLALERCNSLVEDTAILEIIVHLVYVQHRRSTYCQCRTETAKTAAMMTSLVSLFISVPLERGALRQLHKNSSPDFLCLRRRRNWTLRRVLNQVSKMSFQFRVPRYACFFSGNSFRKLSPARLH
jgi:hypothetical protein